MKTGTVFTAACRPRAEMVDRLLEVSGLDELISIYPGRAILIKPNLVNETPPPVTTPVSLVADLIDYLRGKTTAEIMVGEGTASISHDTDHIFVRLGYTEMAAEKGVRLVDLNREPSRRLARGDCRRWPAMHLPVIALEALLISVPVLKAHTLAGVTLTLKNMMGLAPPHRYQNPGSWKKSAFHRDIQMAVADLNRYRCPDFTLLDASTGLADSHLGGPVMDQPPGLLAAGRDPVAMDSFGAGLLGRDWRYIGHIRLLDGEIGQAGSVRIVQVD